MCKYIYRYGNGSEWMSSCSNNVCEQYGKDECDCANCPFYSAKEKE